jgi:ABC-2 type transport system permease protein
MKGLLLKDFCNLRPQFKSYVALLLFYAVLSFVNRSNIMFGAMLAVMGMMVPLTTLAYDEKSGWEKYALTMPLTRRDLFLSRYALGLLITAMVFLLIVVTGAVVSPGDFLDILAAAAGCAGAAVFYISVLLPVCFKVGVERARLIMTVLLFLPAGLVVLLSTTSFTLPQFSADALHTAAVLAPVVLAALLLLSVGISIGIYKKKEF